MIRHLIVAFALLCTLPAASFGEILGSDELTIDFTKADEAKKKATWSEPDKLTITDKGLGWDGPANASRDGWVQTEPLAVGLSWRPAQSVQVHVVISPAPAIVRLPNGQQVIPNAGWLFVRHSADARHWSNWQALNDDFGKNGEVVSFSGTVGIPHRDRAAYERLAEEYHKLDVPWTSDEEALAGWIVQRSPDFFAKERPFVGYVQFLHETFFRGSQRLVRLEATARYTLGGKATVPRDKDAEKDRNVPWRFRAP